MRPRDTIEQHTTRALQVLAWVLAEPDRAARLLALTGLDPISLRTRASEPATLAAILGFIEAHEPDLVTCADALDVPPAVLIEARRALEAA